MSSGSGGLELEPIRHPVVPRKQVECACREEDRGIGMGQNMPVKPKRRCPSRGTTAIEEPSFPFEHLSDIAELESWRKEINRPIYHIHKWWAQRLGSVFRAILIAAFSPPDTKGRPTPSRIGSGWSGGSVTASCVTTGF